MKKPTKKKQTRKKRRSADPYAGKGGRALERVKQERRARGQDDPEVESPTPSGELPLQDEEKEEGPKQTDDTA